jgi:modulator of drug activity B
MMKNVLIINGHQKHDVVAEGKLTKNFIDTANDFFTRNGYNVKNSIVESDYNIEEECEKFKWDEAHVATHKTFQFCGLKPMKTYSVHDIFKGDLDINMEIRKFNEVLEKNFKG